MNIIIKEADFSLVSIGKNIVIPEALKPAIQAFGGLDETKTSALISLYEALESRGYWARIKKLYAPVLASDLSKANINLLDGGNDFSLTDFFAIDQYGLTRGSGASTAISPIPYTTPLNNITSFVMDFNEVNIAQYTDCVALLGFSTSSYKRAFTPYKYLNTSSNGLRVTINGGANINSTIASMANNTSTASLIAVGINSGKIFFAAKSQFEQTTQSVSGTSTGMTTYTNRDNDDKPIIGSAGHLHISISGLMDGLSEADYLALQTIFYDFRAALGLSQS